MTAEYQKMLKAYHKRCLFMILLKEGSYTESKSELLDYIAGLRIESLDKTTFAVFDKDPNSGVSMQYWITQDGYLLRSEEIIFEEV